MVLWCVTTLVLSVVIHYLTIRVFPYVILDTIQVQYAKNTVIHFPRVTAESRVVVRSSPDLFYSLSVFDVSDGPLLITYPLTGSYMSVSMYADNTDNFFVMNDLEVNSPQFNLVLIGPKDSDPDIEGVDVVRSPTKSGIIIFRYFAGDGGEAEEIESVQQQISLSPVDKG